MSSLGDELRLLIFVAVQALVLVGCWRFASRFTSNGLQRAIDTLVLTYLVQYAAVMLPGLVRMLSPVSMLVTGGVMGGVLLAIGMRPIAATEVADAFPPDAKHPRLPSRRSDIRLLIGAFFVSGFVLAYLWSQCLLPPLGTDVLTYHFPAAVQWLQDGRLERFQTWFFNPANTYSPLAGSAWYAWLLGPIGNDTLAVGGQAPMVLLLFLAAVSIGRSLGATTLTAVLVAAALCLCRPVVYQIDKGKDDLFLSAFFAVAVAAIVAPKQDPRRAWRIGVALGLCLAVKYTAILAMPALLLAARKPRWQDAVIIAGCIAILAGPWYLANFINTGNPLYPTDILFFKGLFTTARSEELRSIRGILGAITGGAFGLPISAAGVLTLGWLAGTAAQVLFPPRRERILVTFGPVIGLAVFLLLSPYPEVRFLLPSLVLMTAALNLVPGRYAVVVAGAAAIAAVATSVSLPSLLFELTATASALAAIGFGIMIALRRLNLPKDKLAMAGAAVLMVIGGYTWVNWQSFVASRRVGATAVGWKSEYREAEVWRFVRDELPAGETVAYTGTHVVYPLMGFDLTRPVRYIPARRGVGTLADLPYLGDHLSGEEIGPAVKRAMAAGVDRGVWLGNLRDSHICYAVALFEIKTPEPAWMAAMPEQFERLYADDAGVVYRVKPWPPALPSRSP